MRLITFSSLVSPTLRSFTTLCHIKARYYEKKLLNIIRVFLFRLQISPETFLILRRIERDMIKNIHWSSSKVHINLVTLQWKLNFLNRFSKNTQILNFVEIRPVGAESFQADGRTDRPIDVPTLTVVFRNFANEPQKINTYVNSSAKVKINWDVFLELWFVL